MTAPRTAANGDPLNRRLNISLDIDFREGGKIHSKRLDAVAQAVTDALDVALAEQLPELVADVTARNSWSYVWREQSATMVLGPEDDEV